MGRKERERVREFQATAERLEKRPRIERDEIARERGVQLISEGRGAFSMILVSLNREVLIA